VELPELLCLGDGTTHDLTLAKTLAIPPGSIVSMDRGYVDGGFFADLHDRGILFLTGLKRGMKYRVIRWRKVPRKIRGITSDQEILLTGAA
jgi:putative transposase